MGTYIHVTYSDDVETAPPLGGQMGIRVDSIIPIKNFGMSGPWYSWEIRMTKEVLWPTFPAVYFSIPRGVFETALDVTLGLAGTLIAILALGMTQRNYLTKPPSTAAVIVIRHEPVTQHDIASPTQEYNVFT